MDILDIPALQRTKPGTDPFDHVIARGFVSRGGLKTVNGDFPRISKPGDFPLDELEYGPGFGKLITELRGDDFRTAVESKFDIDLRNRPMIITVRGQGDDGGGQICTGAKQLLVTVLLFLRKDGGSEGAGLTLHRGPANIDDIGVTIPPVSGTMVAFRSSETSWHSYPPHDGDLRVVKLCWASSEKYATHANRGTWISALFRKLGIMS